MKQKKVLDIVSEKNFFYLELAVQRWVNFLCFFLMTSLIKFTLKNLRIVVFSEL